MQPKSAVPPMEGVICPSQPFFKLNTPSIPSEGPLGDHAIFARCIAKEYFTTLFRLEVHSRSIASPDRIAERMTIFN